MVDKILSEQIVNGRRYSSPLIDKDGNKQVVFGLRAANTEAKALVQRPVTYRQPLQTLRKSPVYQPKPVSQGPKSEKSSAPAKPQVRIPVFYICLLIVVVAFSLIALNWQNTQNTSVLDGLSVAPDDSIEGYMTDYAYQDERPDVGFDFPLMVTEVFATTPYTVKIGDTISGIASEHNILWGSLIAINRIEKARGLRAGETIKIPNMDGVPYIVQSGDTYQSIAKTTQVPLEAILDANDVQSEADLAAGMELFIPGGKMNRDALTDVIGDNFIWPLAKHHITSEYGWRIDPVKGVGRRMHEGIDLAASAGTSIRAAMNGTVSSVGEDPVYGKYVIITHSKELQTLYAHMSYIEVKVGNFVYQGNRIGKVGSTGYVTGPHLHFGVYKNGKSVNPLLYVK